jgi:hypothetical protein
MRHERHMQNMRTSETDRIHQYVRQVRMPAGQLRSATETEEAPREATAGSAVRVEEESRRSVSVR